MDKIPQNYLCSRNVLQMVISYAIADFHDGNCDILKAFKSTSVENIFPEKKYESDIPRMNKKQVRKLKSRGKY